MSAYNRKFNKDDIAERNAIASILNVLHNNVSFVYVHDDNQEEVIEIPFYHSLTGDERLLMDTFLKEFSRETAETQYDKVPRGIVYVESSNIRTEALTNPYVRLPEVREEKENPNDEVGELKTYYSLYTSVPIQLNLSCRIKVASHRDLLIISETLKKEFFRNKRFYYDYRGIRVPGNISFPDSIDRENPIEYTFGEDRNQELILALEVETFLPAYNQDTAIFAGTRMAEIDNTVINRTVSE